MSIDTFNFDNPDKRGVNDPVEDYMYGESSLITDVSRVYKGGSWNDRPFWLTPVSLLFLAPYSASSTIFFLFSILSFVVPAALRASPRLVLFFPLLSFFSYFL